MADKASNSFVIVACRRVSCGGRHPNSERVTVMIYDAAARGAAHVVVDAERRQAGADGARRRDRGAPARVRLGLDRAQPRGDRMLLLACWRRGTGSLAHEEQDWLRLGPGRRASTLKHQERSLIAAGACWSAGRAHPRASSRGWTSTATATTGWTSRFGSGNDVACQDLLVAYLTTKSDGMMDGKRPDGGHPLSVEWAVTREVRKHQYSCHKSELNS